MEISIGCVTLLELKSEVEAKEYPFSMRSKES